MTNSNYPFNTIPTSIPATINALRTELEEQIKETIFEIIGSNIPQRELESLMNSFSPIIQKQVDKYTKDFNKLNQSKNYTTSNSQYYPNPIEFNEYSPMMPNHFNFPNNGTFIEPKRTKPKKANFRKKRQNL